MAETGASKSELVVGRCYAGTRTGQPQKRRAPEGACTRELLERFIEVLTDTCNVTEAARAVDRTTGVIYRWRQKDPAFRAAWDRALDAGFAALEMELLRRARFGQDVTEYRTGEDGKEVPVKRVHSYCNRLGLQLLAQHAKTVGAYRAAQGGGSDGSRALEAIRRKLLAMKARGGG
jgi:hypothetical protein